MASPLRGRTVRVHRRSRLADDMADEDMADETQATTQRRSTRLRGRQAVALAASDDDDDAPQEQIRAPRGQRQRGRRSARRGEEEEEESGDEEAPLLTAAGGGVAEGLEEERSADEVLAEKVMEYQALYEETPPGHVTEEEVQQAAGRVVRCALLRAGADPAAPLRRADLVAAALQGYQGETGRRKNPLAQAALSLAQLRLVEVFGMELKRLEQDPTGRKTAPAPVYLLHTLLPPAARPPPDDATAAGRAFALVVLALLQLAGHPLPEDDLWAALAGLGVHQREPHPALGNPEQQLARCLQRKYVVEAAESGAEAGQKEYALGPAAREEFPEAQLQAYTELGRLLLAGGAGFGGAWYASRAGWVDLTEASFQGASAAAALLRALDAESAHDWSVWAAAHGLVPRERRPNPPCLRTQLWGRTFPNPLGLAAGFDKNGAAVEGLLGLGLGFVEAGSVTPLPQPGNPKPRVFRLPEHGAVINRYGFNNVGATTVRANLAAYRQSLLRRLWADPTLVPGQLGVNLGKNKVTEDAASDYCLGVEQLSPLADFLVINVSSPNTPGLRALQGRRALQDLVQRVQAARDALPWGLQGPPPLLVKVAPDLGPEERRDVAAVALAARVDGLVVSNTTTGRPAAIASHPHAAEAGGLSGRPLMDLATDTLADFFRLTGGRIPLVGVGGVASGADAYRKIRAGASLVELYTGLVYGGPALVPAIKRDLATLLRADGFASVRDAVGVDVRL